jgi:acyl-[acyl-carrier-protein] desaturase
LVAEHLSLLLAVERAWQPTDYLPDLTREDWREQVQRLREPAAGLSDAVLVVLVADMITEEALPSYSVALNTLAEDYDGTNDRPLG